MRYRMFMEEAPLFTRHVNDAFIELHRALVPCLRVELVISCK